MTKNQDTRLLLEKVWCFQIPHVRRYVRVNRVIAKITLESSIVQNTIARLNPQF